MLPPQSSHRQTSTDQTLWDDRQAQSLLMQMWMVPDLMRVLGITRKTAEKLVALKVEQSFRTPAVSLQDLNDRDPTELTQALEQVSYEREAEIAAVIGQEKMPKWKEFEASLTDRVEARQLQFRLAASAAPLTDGQVDELTRVLYQHRLETDPSESDPFAATVMSPGVDYIELLVESDRERLRRASPLLTPAQEAEFREMQAAEREIQRVMEERFSERSGSRTPTSGVD